MYSDYVILLFDRMPKNYNFLNRIFPISSYFKWTGSETIWSVLLTIYYLGNQIKNEMGGACGIYGGQERCLQGFGGDT